jgi:hypothetical protein
VRAFADKRQGEKLPPIQHIYLTNCKLVADDMDALVSANMRTKGVSLGGNDIGDDGAKRLAAGIVKRVKLGQTPVIDYIGLSSCGIGPEGANALGPALSKCHHLEKVVFFGNRPGAYDALRASLRPAEAASSKGSAVQIMGGGSTRLVTAASA